MNFAQNAFGGRAPPRREERKRLGIGEGEGREGRGGYRGVREGEKAEGADGVGKRGRTRHGLPSPYCYASAVRVP